MLYRGSMRDTCDNGIFSTMTVLLNIQTYNGDKIIYD